VGINFRIRDFKYPFSIVKLKRVFDKNQWLSEEALYQYQSTRLRRIITHAYHNVPYYQKLFKDNNIMPDDIKTWKDLEKIPFLTKDLLKRHFNSLIARNAKKYRPVLLSTSGTTGSKIDFYVDKPSNILEFVYYWRFWGWAGYKLGDTFAALSSEDFVYIQKNRDVMYSFNPFTRQLTVNSMLLSRKYLDGLVSMFRKFKPGFLKGFPLNLYTLALVLSQKRDHGIVFKAIFSQGSHLLPYQRDLIETVFSCRIFDTYGHMERTVAISQCPLGSYHVHPDYGVVEFEDPRVPLVNACHGDTFVQEVIGTSIHNFSMPLIRYRTGDFVEIKRLPEKCLCGRGLPTIVSVVGRDLDIVITPDRRAIAGLPSTLGHTPGIVMGQIIQENINKLLVKIVCASEDVDKTERILMRYLRDFVGDEMDIKIEHTTIEGIRKDNYGKFKTVISNVPHEVVLD
jgi:phenylacetate-CoA ligase